MERTYTEVAIQWLILIGLISPLPITAFRFRRIALRNGRRGWPYFLLGFVASLSAFVVVMALLSVAMYRFHFAADSKIRSTLLFLSAVALTYIIMFLLITLFKNRLEKPKDETTILDADL